MYISQYICISQLNRHIGPNPGPTPFTLKTSLGLLLLFPLFQSGKDVLKTCWRCLKEVSKALWETKKIIALKISWRHLQDDLKANKSLLGCYKKMFAYSTVSHNQETWKFILWLLLWGPCFHSSIKKIINSKFLDIWGVTCFNVMKCFINSFKGPTQ